MSMLSTATLLRRPAWQLGSSSSSGIAAIALRCLSSSSSNKQDGPILLYQRANNRAAFPRAVLALSTFNSVYWFWYTLDFIPAVNQSPIDDFHVEPTFGYLGIALSLTLQTATLLYPQYLVSKLEYDEKTQDLTIYHHDVPTIFPSALSFTYPLGKLTLDAGSADAKKLVDTQDLYRGSLALMVGGSRLPQMVDIQDGELKDSMRFIQILVTPERVINLPNSSSSSNSKTDNKKTSTKKKKRARRR